jgi:ubiquinone/menaquinone biosynthesis C-methylase UbiE
MPPFTPQSEDHLRGEVRFRRFHALGVNDRTLAYMRLCLRERRDLFRGLALSGRRLSPFVEIGAETGANSLLLADDLRASGLALDVSREALAAMGEYGAALGATTLPMRVWGDAHALPVRNHSVALAVAWGTLHHFPDPRPVLAELRRVLAPGGMLVVGDEPVRRLLSFHFGRTRAWHALGPLARGLVRAHVLPWFVDVDGREAVAAGAAEMLWPRGVYKQLLTAFFEKVDLHDYPYTTATIRSAGPLARLLLRSLGPTLARKAETVLFGGAIGAYCEKAPELQATASPSGADGQTVLWLRKKPQHDFLTLVGDGLAAAALKVEGQPVIATRTARGVQLALPPETKGRGSAAVTLDRRFAPDGFVFTRGADDEPLWIPLSASPPPAESVEQTLACPSCWEIDSRCRADLCGQPCVRLAAQACLRAVNGRAELVVAGADPGYRAVLACPVAAIDRARLVPLSGSEGGYRCLTCGAAYAVSGGVTDLLSARARRALAGLK